MLSRRCLLVLPFAAALCLTPPSLRADTASARLAVGATVARSCAVRVTPVDRGSATLELQCTAGAAAGLRSVAADNSSGTIRIQTRTVPHEVNPGFDLATVLF